MLHLKIYKFTNRVQRTFKKKGFQLTSNCCVRLVCGMQRYVHLLPRLRLGLFKCNKNFILVSCYDFGIFISWVSILSFSHFLINFNLFFFSDRVKIKERSKTTCMYMNKSPFLPIKQIKFPGYLYLEQLPYRVVILNSYSRVHSCITMYNYRACLDVSVRQVLQVGL